MSFLKKNWLKLIIAVIALVGIIVNIVLLTNGLVKDTSSYATYANKMAYSNLFMVLAQLIFFLGLFTYVAMSMFENMSKIKNYVLLGTGILALIFVILSISNGSSYLSALQDYIDAQKDQIIQIYPAGAARDAALKLIDGPQYQITSAIITKVVAIIVYGLLPAAYATHKLVKKED